MEIIIVFSNKDRAKNNGWEFTPDKPDDLFKIGIGADGLRQVWIAYDKIENPSEFIQAKLEENNLLPNIINVLFHSYPDETLIQDLQINLQEMGIICYTKKSKHSVPKDYKKVTYFMDNEYEAKIQLFDELKEWIEIDKNLERKLKFLHSCFTKEEFPQETPEWLIGSAIEKFKILKGIHKERAFENTDYMNTLRELREALLGNY